MFAVGVVVTGATLTKKFDAYFRQALSSRLEALPRQRGEQQKYRIAKPLPDSKSEYDAVKTDRFTTTVEELVADAYCAIEELAQEMEDAFNNMPESLQDGDVGQRRQEAADGLSGLNNRPDVPEDCEDISAVFFPALDTSSRPKRAQEAADMLKTAAKAIRDYLGELQGCQNCGGEVDDNGVCTECCAGGVDSDPDSPPDASEWQELADQLEYDATELESIDFPGMYG